MRKEVLWTVGICNWTHRRAHGHAWPRCPAPLRVSVQPNAPGKKDIFVLELYKGKGGGGSKEHSCDELQL